MAIPSPIRITRNGVEYLSNVDRAKYLLVELQRAALRDVGKLVRKRAMQEARNQPGLRRGKRISKAFQYWVRRRETNLQIGIKHNTWYGVAQELGTKKQPRRAIITNAVMRNIAEIRQIQAVYLKEIEDELRAQAIINEEEEGNDDE